jgi:hypothetical protein
MVALTQEIVLKKTKHSSLEHVKTLNLFGKDIDDVSILEQMPHVEVPATSMPLVAWELCAVWRTSTCLVQVLSLSMNKISSLKDFRHCTQLRELYLRRNQVSFGSGRLVSGIAGYQTISAGTGSTGPEVTVANGEIAQARRNHADSAGQQP